VSLEAVFVWRLFASGKLPVAYEVARFLLHIWYRP